MNGEQMPAGESHAGRNATVIVVAAAVIAAALLYYWFFMRTGGPALPAEEPLAEETPTDLGSQLYERATNPVAGELPDTVAPVPNPVEGIYQNPFE